MESHAIVGKVNGLLALELSQDSVTMHQCIAARTGYTGMAAPQPVLGCLCSDRDMTGHDMQPSQTVGGHADLALCCIVLPAQQALPCPHGDT